MYRYSTTTKQVNQFLWSQKRIENRRFLAFANLVWDEFEDGNSVAPLAYTNNFGTSEISGLCWIKAFPNEVEIVNIYVSEQCRGQKVGSYIINDVKKSSAGRNIVLACSLDKVDFYHKHGFEIQGYNKRYAELVDMKFDANKG